MMKRPPAATPPEDIRKAIYAGDVLCLSATAETSAFVAHLREILEASLGAPLERLHERQGYAETEPKMNAIRAGMGADPRYLETIRTISQVAGAPSDMAFDPLRLRCVLPGNHLNKGAEMAYSAHRDTWYGNPQCQVNFWIPLQDVTPENSFLFYPDYFNAPLPNTSSRFSYAEWREKRGWQGSKGDAKVEFPVPLAEPAGGRAFAAKAGEIIMFSAAQLHQTVKSLSGATRFSLDFRAVHLGDHARGIGAPNADNGSLPEALQDYIHPETRAA